jgi:predicted ATPase with chaperone activity
MDARVADCWRLGKSVFDRVFGTIADLDHSEHIQAAHLNEAINYRMLDRQTWT